MFPRFSDLFYPVAYFSWLSAFLTLIIARPILLSQHAPPNYLVMIGFAILFSTFFMMVASHLTVTVIMAAIVGVTVCMTGVMDSMLKVHQAPDLWPGAALF
jgi:hypothetical protein